MYREKELWVCTKCHAEHHEKPEQCGLCKNDRFTKEKVERHHDHPDVKKKYDEALDQLHKYEEGVPKRTRKSGFEE